MSSLDEEYFSFVEHLDASNADLEVRRVAHVIRVNLQRIADAPSAGGRRSHNVAAFLRGGLNRVEELPQLGARAEQDVLTWSDLKALKIGPFRGFRREEIFDLSKRVTLFYGPNGSGKTSLCEAIEYALTGDVEEASLKRAGALGSYFTNIHEGRYLAPVLFSQGEDEGVPVVPVPGLLRFAIIEKNRIESFARIAARTPAQAGELIASLFGLEEFSDFVKQFPAEIDIGLLLETPKKLILEGKASALAAAQARLRDADVTSKAFVDELSALAAELECNVDHVRELIDPDDRQSRLQGLITAADEIIPAQSGLKASGVRPSFLALRRNQRQLRNVRRQLADLAGQVSFKRLFQSIQELRAEAGEACPACLTPLAHAVANPFERADHELRNLQELAVLEDQASTLTEGCNELLRQIRAYLAPIKDQAGYEALANNAVVRWAASGQGAEWNIDGLRAHHVRDVSKALAALEAADLELSTRAESRQQVISERDKLRDIAQRLAVIDAKIVQHEAGLVADKALVEGFELANSDLIESARLEAESYAFETRIRTGYAAFRTAIRAYLDGLPRKFLADLNDLTLDLYNAFNEDDHERDKLTSLSLPLKGGEKIMVAFGADPARMHDALHVLSEGHLRCLGLAILLAKNIKLELPLLVFDDAVNAIDSDHRAGIRKTLFGDERLNIKQIIITCHGNEFIKDIQNQLGNDVSNLYVLSHHDGDHQPRVQGGTSRNYLLRARQFLDEGDQRQCLAFCRQALENVTAKTWKKISGKSRELAQLKLPIAPPIFKPELGALTQALNKALTEGIQRGQLTGQAMTELSAGFQEILNVPNSQLIWSYFNKGTHDEEDREDFEIQAVRQTYAALDRIARALQE